MRGGGRHHDPIRTRLAGTLGRDVHRAVQSSGLGSDVQRPEHAPGFPCPPADMEQRLNIIVLIRVPIEGWFKKLRQS